MNRAGEHKGETAGWKRRKGRAGNSPQQTKGGRGRAKVKNSIGQPIGKYIWKRRAQELNKTWGQMTREKCRGYGGDSSKTC